jgi:predicted phosphodiesterase
LKFGTAIFLTAVSAASAGVASYLLKDRSEMLRWVITGAAVVSPWAAYGLIKQENPTCSFLFVSDTHGAAVNNAALVRAMQQEEGISMVLHGGDISDTAELWPAWWNRPFAPVIAKWPVYAASGNHDVEYALGASEFAARFGILPRRVRCGEDVEIYLLPWDASTFDAKWLWEDVKASKAKWRVLVTHQPVWDLYGDTAGLYALLGPAVMSKINLVLAGHKHVYQNTVHGGTGQVIEVSGPKKYPCPDGAPGCVQDSTGYVRVDVFPNELRVTRKVVS